MTTPATNRQVPQDSILDHFDRQTYLGNSFSLPLSVSLSNTNETPGLLIQNPSVSGSGFPSGYKALFIRGIHASCTGQLTLRVYLNPTVSGTTTAGVPVQQRPANSNASIANAYSSANFSVSANGTLIDVREVPLNVQALSDLLLILDPGQTLLITCQTSTSSTNTVLGGVNWNEF